ncbi:hypothetical protein CBR_g6542 [Chara braunii]|uniref:Amine oxidase domain-containing protein n=1 Tax=Chara braunii TaxID=69332 RepID=A0A388KK63_CHABU|nr:hypothetical protein CBR_g6542 [Chara braunii]|eukprot:GBG70416.1 hypothetical protein CBR_g6542 [Chara braunii]
MAGRNLSMRSETPAVLSRRWPTTMVRRRLSVRSLAVLPRSWPWMDDRWPWMADRRRGLENTEQLIRGWKGGKRPAGHRAGRDQHVFRCRLEEKAHLSLTLSRSRYGVGGGRWPAQKELTGMRRRRRRGRAVPLGAVAKPADMNAVDSEDDADALAGDGSGKSTVRDQWASKGLDGRDSADVVVIGSGIGGLCCGALLAHYGEDVVICESAAIPGGAAHSFERNGYFFDSGPSLFSGLSSRGMQANPLAQVLDAIGEPIESIKYDGWMVYLPEGDFMTRLGPDNFKQILLQICGPKGISEWETLQAAVSPLAKSTMALPPAAIRGDAGVAITGFARYAGSMLQIIAEGGPAAILGYPRLLGPFSDFVSSVGVSENFVLNWIDLLCFLLSGLKADATLAAEVIYIFNEWYRPGCALEYPKGGTGAIIEALVRGLEKHGGRLALRTHVDQILVEGGRAVGVKLRGGRTLKARKAVVSNTSIWDLMKLLPKGALPREDMERGLRTPQLDSFMHLHLGVDAKYVHDNLEIHHTIVNNWDIGIDAPQNVVLISVPTVLDASLAPPGKHLVHAYVPATEPYVIWEGLDRQSAEYKALKEERSEVLWKAVERALGPKFRRDLVEFSLVGSPLTHERFLRRDRGTYGPGIRAGKEIFPGPTTALPGLLCCGDSTFPGIGVPAVAASGFSAANTLAPLWKHWQLLDAIKV